MTARSVIGSLLLGVEPPRLAGRHLVTAGRLFGIEEGTVRVALSRMVAAGELASTDGNYELTGRLLARQKRQMQSRSLEPRRWSGKWVLAVVPSGRRDAEARSALRSAAMGLHFAELREGVWLRPNNFDRDRVPKEIRALASQCQFFSTTPDDPLALAQSLWDLDGWAREAEALRAQMAPFATRLDDHDTEVLAPAFELAASVIRHLMLDPTLPNELLPDHWPGPALREELNRYEEAWKLLWVEYFRARK